MAKMNSTSLYVTTNQIILKSNSNNPSTWQDLYRLVPYLRNSLCCVVCGNLLIEPLTPMGKCQHHLCKECMGGRKKIKPACLWCKDCKTYVENKSLRTLLQCYKKMCIMLVNSGIFRGLAEQASKATPATCVERGAGNLIMLIKEGAAFQDDYQSNAGLTRSTYSILPCIYTNSSTQTLQVATADAQGGVVLNPNVRRIANGTALYSVMYAGSGNKITIKRKQKDTSLIKSQKNNLQPKKETIEKGIFKKPSGKCILKSRRGCRCGNATATPGKLTCCGQRCPCYVESKACLECKCRGCRNPHRPDGNKVRPLISHQEQLSDLQPHHQQQILPNVNFKLQTNLTLEQINHINSTNVELLNSYAAIPTSLPRTILMNDGGLTDEEEINVDI